VDTTFDPFSRRQFKILLTSRMKLTGKSMPVAYAIRYMKYGKIIL
jgi:hypothetical protein